jgi:hypothetical protein
MTLLEVLLASALLAGVLVPVFALVTRGVALARTLEENTRSVFLAAAQMERVLAAAEEDFFEDLSCGSLALGEGYLVTITETDGDTLDKEVAVQVGVDADGDGVLAEAEVRTTLVTIVGNVTEEAGD